MAFGIMWAGTGIGGIIVPFIMNWGLNRYGFAVMLRAWALVTAVFAGPTLFFVKPRVPIPRARSYPPQLSFGFVKTSTFWALQSSNILEGLGFFIPNIWLPTYAQFLGLSSIEGTATIMLFNTTSVVGAVLMGSLTDRFEVTSVMLVSSLGATISVFFCWGFAMSLPLLCIFSLGYGLFAGGFSSTWPGMIKEVKKHDDRADLGLVFGLLAAGRGIGSVVSGPLSEALVVGRPWIEQAASGYGSGYGGLIVFTGVSAALGGSSWVCRRIGWI